MSTASPTGPRTLVAGIGNIFLGDDGFGVETVQRLPAESLPPHVEVADIGIRGVHLAYQLLDGYDTLVLVDATARGGDPGTVYLIEDPAPGAVRPECLPVDGHGMSPDTVLALMDGLCTGTGGTPPRRIVVVGCEPGSVEEGIGLSPPVEAAVTEAVKIILGLVRESLTTT
ncbi:hydrogenase maturation protease [Streptomyces sp. NPDC002004]